MFRGFTLAAAGLLLCAGGYARADGDIIRLGGKGDAGATTLGFSDDGDTVLTRGFRGGYGGYGGYRGGYGGYGGYRGYASYGYGGYRNYGYGYGGYRNYGYGGYYGGYANYYRPYYNYSYYRPYYSNYYYPSYYGGYGYGGYGGYGSYYGGYGGYGGYYPYYSGYYYPCAVVPSVTVNAAPYYNNGAANQQQPSQPFMPPADGKNGQTYPYDGGPASPLPKAGDTDPAKEPIPQPKQPREGRIAIAPLPSPYTFGAYGGQPANQGKVITVVVGKPAPLPSPYAATTASVQRPATTATATKIAYPAYGEQPLAPAVRVQLTQNR